MKGIKNIQRKINILKREEFRFLQVTANAHSFTKQTASFGATIMLSVHNDYNPMTETLPDALIRALKSVIEEVENDKRDRLNVPGDSTQPSG